MIVSSKLQHTRVLLVDDNMADRMVLREGLKTLGFRDIQEAEDGSIAQYKIDNAYKVGTEFNLVFVDINMPRQNGMLLLERLRSHTRTHHLYIVMITGSASLQDVEKAKNNGVDDFIVKPLDIDTLRLKIEAYSDKMG